MDTPDYITIQDSRPERPYARVLVDLGDDAPKGRYEVRVTVAHRDDLFERDVKGSVNWTALGDCSPEETRRYAEAMRIAAELAAGE